MVRQFRFRQLNEEGQTPRGWSDLFNPVFGEGRARSAAALGAAPPSTASLIAESVAFDVVPAVAGQATRLGVFASFPADALVGQAAGGVAIMPGPIQDGIGRDGGPGAFAAGSLGYQILYSEDLSPGLIIDLAKREIVADGTRNLDLGGGTADLLVLSGPLAAPANLPNGLLGLEILVLRPGASYELSASDGHVAAGATLEVNAMALGRDETIAFDGSAESDGSFVFLGGGGADIFRGGRGDDLIFGLGGGDTLEGGRGADIFSYDAAGQSSGAGHDRLIDFDPGEDSIDLPFTVTGFDAAIGSGALSTASFDGDLAAALGGGLGAGRAVFFAPDSGDLAGTIFLIVDGNGEEGYQAGEDYVFALPAGNLADLSTHTDFFV